ncbi:valine-trna ligase [Favolaschia claudopus]|uniref:Valine-trna ligase n=1 Tax=Favolaschia claudopus TaxID=2862362 RepID=A0AAW0C9A8_9AGAR
MSRHSALTLWFLLLCSAHGSLVNVTVEDSDPSIAYSPSSAWNSSTVVCSSCNDPPVRLASQETYHKGLHVVVLDKDDFSSPSALPSSTSPPAHSAAPSSPPDDDDEDDDDDKDNDHHDKDDDEHDNDTDTDEKKSGKNRRRRRDAFRLARLDTDDPGFVDQPVSAQFNFTGTAIYVFCIQPLGLSTSPTLPTTMNATFSVDGVQENPFFHGGSASASGFAYQSNVLSKQGLSDGPHRLKIDLAPNTVFILDYILVTQNAQDAPSGSAAADDTPTQTSSVVGVPSDLSTPSSGDEKSSNAGRASFAGAVAGSLGVLGILCFGTAFSIYRRRQLAARRERLERGNAPPTAPMSGPAPFVPRYFPGTVVPTTPPPYEPSDDASSSDSSHSSTLTAISQPLLATHPEQTYVDDPRPSIDAPPSFGVAITTPAVTLLSASDVVSPPPRPASWGPAPQPIPLPTIPPGIVFTTPEVTLISSSDAAAAAVPITPPPRPASWGPAPHAVPLPPSIAPQSRSPSIYSTEDDMV